MNAQNLVAAKQTAQEMIRLLSEVTSDMRFDPDEENLLDEIEASLREAIADVEAIIDDQRAL